MVMHNITQGQLMDKYQYLLIKNFKLILIVLFLSFFISLIFREINIILFTMLAFVVLGIVNGIYWFYVVMSKRIDKIVLILIIAFIWPILSIVGTIILLPLILFEIYTLTNIIIKKLLIMTNEKIGADDKVNQETKNYEKNRKLCTCVSSILILLLTIVLVLLNISWHLKFLISVVFIVIYYIVINIINSKLLRKFDYVLYNNCDSKSYYVIFKYLKDKYPKEYLILQAYSTALRFDQNDLSELKLFIRQYNRYNKYIFYLRALFDTANEQDKESCFYEFYNKAKLFNSKMYKKTGKVSWYNNIKYLEIEYFQFQKEYEEALNISKTVKDDGMKINNIRCSFIRGECFFFLGRMSEAEKEFKYVAKEGNTLRMSFQAKEYLDIIQN